jgi:isopentenyldiphosphate isomerase
MADERVEAWDWATGKPAGRAVSRAEAHRTGIPHEGVHLWIISMIDGTAHMLLQRRAPGKEFYPGYLDITVGGHVVFGQKENKLSKEAEEELGIIPSEKDIIDLGFFRYEETIPEFSLIHREFQHIWLLFDNRPLDAYHFNDGEVDALAAISYPAFRDIITGGNRCGGYLYDGVSIDKREFIRDEFHPLFFTAPMTGYLRYLTGRIDSLLMDRQDI